MYRIYWINFDYFSQDVFETLESAIKYAKSKSFQFVIYSGNQIVYR